MTDRQRMAARVHILGDGFAPDLWPASHTQPIAAVDILDGLRIQSDDPQVFYRLAAVLIAAANSVEDVQREKADKEAARQQNLAMWFRNREPFGTPVQHVAVTAPEVDGEDAA